MRRSRSACQALAASRCPARRRTTAGRSRPTPRRGPRSCSSPAPRRSNGRASEKFVLRTGADNRWLCPLLTAGLAIASSNRGRCAVSPVDRFVLGRSCSQVVVNPLRYILGAGLTMTDRRLSDASCLPGAAVCSPRGLRAGMIERCSERAQHRTRLASQQWHKSSRVPAWPPPFSTELSRGQRLAQPIFRATSYLLRITGRAWSKAVAVTVICIAGIAARAVAVPVVVADISHALAYRELAHRSGEIAYGHRRCRHGQGAAQRGARDNT